MARLVFNLAAAAQGASANFVGGMDHFQYMSYSKSEPYYEEETIYTPLNNTQVVAGGKIDFDLERRNTFMRGATELRFNVSPVTNNGGLVFRFDDFAGLTIIDRIEWVYNNKRIWQETPERMKFKLATRFNASQRTPIINGLGGNLTDLERRALATVNQNFVIPVWTPWRKFKKQLPMIGVPNKIRMSVFMKPFAQVGFSSVAPFNHTWTYSGVTLRTEGNDVDEKKKNYHWDSSKSGLVIKTVDFEEHRREIIPTGTSQFRLKIRNIKNDCFNMYFTLRNVAEVDDATQRNVWNYLNCLSFQVVDGNQPMTDVMTTRDFVLTQWNEIYPDAESDQGYHVIPWCPRAFVRLSDDDCYGSRAFVHYNNPELVINFAAPTAQPIYCDLVGEIHNQLIFKLGDIRPLVN
jgi:hypothetical protein